ncbi:MAG: segregation/condensation protein A [Clostridia bacterium]|nr:segregation/condensation protein A [Clostridia bacterium]
MYELKLERFEGPLDLLLHLIREAKIDIKDIFISEITSQFIEYVERNKYTMDDVSEFLEMAATLMYIKSRHLLPKQEIEEDPEELEQKLILQLEEYQKYKQLAEVLEKEIAATPKTFTKYKDEFVTSDDRIDIGLVTLDVLVEAFKRLLEERKEEGELPVLTSQRVMRKDKYTIVEKMDYILTKVSKKGKIRFEELFEDKDRGDMVISFLSMLELLNQGKLKVYQTGFYNTIMIECKDEKNNEQD